jgi:hypothetical protein
MCLAWIKGPKGPQRGFPNSYVQHHLVCEYKSSQNNTIDLNYFQTLIQYFMWSKLKLHS